MWDYQTGGSISAWFFIRGLVHSFDGAKIIIDAKIIDEYRFWAVSNLTNLIFLLYYTSVKQTFVEYLDKILLYLKKFSYNFFYLFQINRRKKNINRDNFVIKKLEFIYFSILHKNELVISHQ